MDLEAQPPAHLLRGGRGDPEAAASVPDLQPDAERRLRDDGEAYLTDEGHYILDCAIPPDTDAHSLAAALAPLPGVVEHGLFLDMASLALLGSEDGNVERLEDR